MQLEPFEKKMPVSSYFEKGEPVWPSGKAGKQRDLGSNLLRLSFLFNKCGLWTLSCL